ncbi:hypothetical protein [Bacillus massiliglaciei]|uniref:hypothetical protein n=1 Tax=Bacillus massiliglaciei TaxID=1816693 RepID=UPI000DA5ECAA|nr:hypothetical protein [Bacillus massiliglaciei]
MRKTELYQEIQVLNEMKFLLENYIQTFRMEQANLRDFINEIGDAAWKSGKAKEAFFNRVSNYEDDFVRNIQRLENTYLAIVETRTQISKLYSLADQQLR